MTNTVKSTLLTGATLALSSCVVPEGMEAPAEVFRQAATTTAETVQAVAASGALGPWGQLLALALGAVTAGGGAKMLHSRRKAKAAECGEKSE